MKKISTLTTIEYTFDPNRKGAKYTLDGTHYMNGGEFAEVATKAALGYDAHTGRIFMAVYKGKKPQYPNYPLFSLDVKQKPGKAVPAGLSEKHETLQLSQDGLFDEASGVHGWKFKWGSTGLCPLGDGLWYISENHKDKATGIQSCTARLYRWTGLGDQPFKAAR